MLSKDIMWFYAYSLEAASEDEDNDDALAAAFEDSDDDGADAGIDEEGAMIPNAKKGKGPNKGSITDKEFYKAMQKLKDRGSNAVPPKKSASAYIIFGKEVSYSFYFFKELLLVTFNFKLNQ